MPLSEILVPVDFSGRNTGAARYAEALHRIFGSHVTLLHVLPPPHYEFGAMEVGGSVLEELFRSRSEQAANDLAAFMVDELPPGIAARTLLEGDPASMIVKTAHDLAAGLVVMPTHGHGAFRRLLLGSVTAKVLHDSDCPVFTGVHLEAESVDAIRFRRIAVAIDLGPQTERALMWARRFSEVTGATLIIVHATPNLEGRAGEYFDPDWRKHIEAQVREEVDGLRSRLGIDAPLHVDSGDAPDVVCTLAKEMEADLLVIGRGSAAGAFGRLRANAYSIIRQASCPVVSV